MSAHAKLSPSSSGRWMNCPGSVRLAARYPDTAGAYAREGTFAHYVAQRCLEDGDDARSWLGKTSKSGEFTCTQEMVDAVQLYLDAVRSITLTDGAKPEDVQVEAKVELAGVLGLRIYGTADALVWADRGRKLHVFDFKYGAGVMVPADDNSQLDIYAVGALVTYGYERARFGLKNVEVVVHIVQPRCDSMATWRSSKPRTAPDLLGWADSVLVPAAHATEHDDADLVPGESQCRFCPAKVECPALREQTLEVARAVFDDDLVEPKAPEVEMLSAEDVARLLAAAPRVRDYLNAVEKRAAELASGGQTVPGYKLVERVGNRKWTNEADAEAALRGAEVDPFERPKLLSPAKAEKALGRARAKLVAELVHKPVTGTVLVADSDPRPAIDVAAVFPSVLD